MIPRTLQDYDAFLFDIDGTLINCTDAVHYFAFCEALEFLAGRPLNLDGVVAHGNTDVGILRDALHLAEIPEALWRPKLPAARSQMCAFVAQRTGDLRITVLPGVVPLLAQLQGKGKPLGVATGNLEQIGQAKLQTAGLLPFFDFGAYSDHHEHRRDVFAAAVEQARKTAGTAARLCVLGDTPEDIRAARANNLDVMAVATGVFSLHDLSLEKPDRCLASLETLLTESAPYSVHSSN